MLNRSKKTKIKTKQKKKKSKKKLDHMSPQHSEYKSAKFIHSDTYIHTHTYRHSTAADLKSRKKFFFYEIFDITIPCVSVYVCVLFSYVDQN